MLFYNFFSFLADIKLVDIPTWITTFVTIYIAIFGSKQLRIIQRQNSISNIIELEKSLSESQRLIDEYVSILQQNIDKNGNLKIKKPDNKIISLLNSEMDNYFQILDRVCFCFLHNYIPDDEINDEYFYLIKKIFEDVDYNKKISPYYNNLITYYNKKVKSSSP